MIARAVGLGHLVAKLLVGDLSLRRKLIWLVTMALQLMRIASRSATLRIFVDWASTKTNVLGWSSVGIDRFLVHQLDFLRIVIVGLLFSLGLLLLLIWWSQRHWRQMHLLPHGLLVLITIVLQAVSSRG